MMKKALSNFQRAKLLCPNLPWCQDNVDQLGQVVTNFVYDQEAYIRKWAQRWFENFQYIFGNTSIKWSRKYDFAVDVDFLRKSSAMNQRAATNVSRTVVEALSAMLYSNLPTWSAESASQSNLQGKRYAKIVEKLLDAYMDRLSMDKEFAMAATAFIAFGQMAFRADWDETAGSSIAIPQWQKIKAPLFTDFMATNPITGGLFEVPTSALDSNGQPYYQDRWEPVMGPDGKQSSNSVRAGDLKSTVLTPFEYRREIGSHGMHTTRYVEHIRLIDFDQYLTEYDNVGQKTKYFYDVQPFMNDSMMYAFAVRHFMRLQFTTPPTLPEGLGFSRSQSVLKGSMFRNKVLVIEHFDKPNPETWPKGRRLIIVNGKCTNVGEPQYYLDKPGGWHPFSEAQWLTIPPSSVACGPMDSVTAKNRELNVLDSLISTSVRRNFGSTLLVKGGSGFDPQKFNGEPGQHHMVNDVVGAARWLHDDVPISPAINPLRAAHKEDIYEASGAQDALRGDRSKGVSAGYAMRQLQEREERRLTPARKSLEYSIGDHGEKLIAGLRQNVTKLDENVIGYLRRRSAGEFQPQDIISFLTAPIDFGIDIRIETSSMNLKSKASLQADMLELGKGPAQARLQNDAGVLDEFLKMFGAEKLRDKSASHRDRAKRENEIFSDMLRMGPDTMGIVPPIVLFEDDDNIHMQEHIDFQVINAEEIMRNEFFMQQFLIHMEHHRLSFMEKQGQLLPGTALQAPMMMAGSRMQPPPGAPQIYQKAVADAAKPQQTPQAPKEPKQAGEKQGPSPTVASAPAQNTQQGGTVSGP
jgi:hypothetical protein